MKPEDIEDLKQLIEFLKENQVAEFDLDRGDLKIRLKFNQRGARQGYSDLARLMPQRPGGCFAGRDASAGRCGARCDAGGSDPDAGLHIVKSPIVGTYYGSPSPGAAPFVCSRRSRVTKGQIICIVEAMKLMNEIESDAAGEIVKCFVTNGQPIEFGQPLFSIRAGDKREGVVCGD